MANYGYSSGGSASLYQATQGAPAPIYTGPYYGQMRNQINQSQQQLGGLYGQQQGYQQQMNQMYTQDPGEAYLRQLLSLYQNDAGAGLNQQLMDLYKPVTQQSVASQFYGY